MSHWFFWNFSKLKKFQNETFLLFSKYCDVTFQKIIFGAKIQIFLNIVKTRKTETFILSVHCCLLICQIDGYNVSSVRYKSVRKSRKDWVVYLQIAYSCPFQSRSQWRCIGNKMLSVMHTGAKITFWSKK